MPTAGVDQDAVRQYLRAFDFVALFIEELGWSRYSASDVVEVRGQTYTVKGIAENAGVAAFQCEVPNGVPDRATRGKIAREVAQLVHENILVFVDAARTTQVWHRVIREPGRPPAAREQVYHSGQSGQLLAEKLNKIAFSLDEVARGLSVAEVATQVAAAFDVDKVTKRFYDRFQKEHDAFLAFVEGIAALNDRTWYTSLLLNRLMFIYFFQKRGFLDGDVDYLRHRLQMVRDRRGNGQLLSFYRSFLTRLFHEGLGRPEAQRDPALDALMGKVPYLNGGLFDEHALERSYPEIDLPDEAFARVFDFFDAYDWHLDERPLRDDREINPDVLGYIFEKYVNQKQMGAYYTKEDITEYIARNTVVPFLFDAAEKRCAVAFQPDSALWALLRDDPDRYIFPSVLQGVDLPLPPEIEAGVADVSRRGGWNRPAAAEHALPTESWREHVARRRRCLEVRTKLRAGEVHAIDDLVTLNLNIRQLAQDAIENAESADLLRAFWQSLAGRLPEHSHERWEQGISVLDPTCGSGAFLFAALNVLLPLYEACLERMQGFVDEADAAGGKTRYADFRRILERVARHPNRRYFALKSIILENLYGVDIMEEAVEICQLRLFLKLVAQLEPGDPIEPLPDIDFNIRAGNTLVGFATLEQVRHAMTTTAEGQARMLSADEDDALKSVQEKAEIASRAFQQFRQQQGALGGEITPADKADLRRRLESLDAELDALLARQYGADPEKPAAYAAWRASHQPFHWFVEFYAIMSAGGFDVIIGNPPYVEYARIRARYTVLDLQTLPCGNIYAFTVERSLLIGCTGSRVSMIVPLSLVCTDRTAAVREMVCANEAWMACYDMRPSSLFEGVAQRLAIFIAHCGVRGPGWTGGYRRWGSRQRPDLIPTLVYAPSPKRVQGGPISKFAERLESETLSKIARLGVGTLQSRTTTEVAPIYVHRVVRYFVKALDFLPLFVNASGAIGKSEDYKEFQFRAESLEPICAIINSSLFYWFWRSHSDGFHCGYGDVFRMPDPGDFVSSTAESLGAINRMLMTALRESSSNKTISSKAGQITYQEFYPKISKPIIDEIDRVLAKHYGFTDEELDFIINYDIKYRMGAETNEE